MTTRSDTMPQNYLYEGSYPCAECSSFEANVGFYEGWCCMLSKPRGVNQRSLYIGRTYTPLTGDWKGVVFRLEGLDGHCFSKRTNNHTEDRANSEGVGRYVPVTRTESAKSGHISDSLA